MTDRNKTLVEIMAEMREYQGHWAYYDGGLHHESGEEEVVSVGILHEFADRAEAAWKEEKRLLVLDAENAKEARNKAGIKLRSEFMAKCRECKGNVAKLREALQSMIQQENPLLKPEEIDRDALCGRCLNGKNMFKDCKHDGSCWVDKVWDALSAPPRNCDVGTALDMAARFEEFCHAHSNKCRECPIHRSGPCEFAWGQLSYEAPAASGSK